MPSQIKSISPLRVGLGVIVALLAVALVGLGYYQPSLAVLVATAFLALAVALQGMKPFGDSIAYHLLQAAAFAFWGAMVIVTEELTLIPVVFVVVGVSGIFNYGRQAVRKGIWIPATE